MRHCLFFQIGYFGYLQTQCLCSFRTLVLELSCSIVLSFINILQRRDFVERFMRLVYFFEICIYIALSFGYYNIYSLSYLLLSCIVLYPRYSLFYISPILLLTGLCLTETILFFTIKIFKYSCKYFWCIQYGYLAIVSEITFFGIWIFLHSSAIGWY